MTQIETVLFCTPPQLLVRKISQRREDLAYWTIATETRRVLDQLFVG